MRDLMICRAGAPRAAAPLMVEETVMMKENAASTSSYDAIIIGAGHNGLVCANYLARAGKRVLVLERRDVIGGAAVTQEFAPGFKASTFSYMMSLLHPRIVQDFGLRARGLKVLPCADMVAPVDGGEGYILFSDNVEATQKSFARFSQKDAEIYPAFDAYLREATDVIRKLLWETPFDPSKGDMKTYRQLLSFAWRYRRIGRKMYRIIDLLSQSAYDFLREWFEDERVISTICYYCSIGTFAGPKSPGTAYVIMHHIMGENQGPGGWGFIQGGMGRITETLADYGREKGVEIVTNAAIREIDVRDGRAVAVVTEEGRVYSAKVIASNASAKILYKKLVGQQHLPAEVKRQIDNYRTFSTAFKMNVACERPPQYHVLERLRQDGVLGSFPYPTYLHICPDVDYLERAYDDAKHGGYSREPFMTQVVPTFADHTLAPEGKHVVNFFGGHAPYELKSGSWDTERANFRANIYKAVEKYAPGFESDVIAEELFLPPDIERVAALPQGHIFHGELAPDQLFFQRPVSGYADYRTPVDGLYICGSSMHPGGGVSGIPGHNAAREILKDQKIKM
jgi:phytoene dehydrogenase-like protein